jgi:hypothetical protein
MKKKIYQKSPNRKVLKNIKHKDFGKKFDKKFIRKTKQKGFLKM